jgi:hypothetical protein
MQQSILSRIALLFSLLRSPGRSWPTRPRLEPLETRDLLSTISDRVFPLLGERVQANQEHFFVYRDADSAFNHGFPSGIFGAVSKVEIDAAGVDDPASPTGVSNDPDRLDLVRGNVLRVTFDPLTLGQFAGFNFEEPEHFGAQGTGRGYDLRGATHVEFDVRSPTTGGVRVQFGVDGSVTPFMHIPQSPTYTHLSIPLASLGLSSSDLADVHLLFTVVTNDFNAPDGGTVLIDNIAFTPVPTVQQSQPGFPLANETFGVVPLASPAEGRVSFPLDQVLRNVSTTYESALTGISLLARPTPKNLQEAQLIADTFVYALHHDNRGDPLPAAPDGSVGLHDGMFAGDLALYNDQTPGPAQQGDIRLAGFSTSSGFNLLLDGATGGNNAFAMLFLIRAYRQFGDLRYLQAARTIGHWIVGNLEDTSGTGFGGYFLGYPAEGVQPKLLIRGKSIENNADIFSAFTALAAEERLLGNTMDADFWTTKANVAGDFALAMYDSTEGRFNAGTVLAGTEASPGITPMGPPVGDDVINTFDFLDATTFVVLALAHTDRYGDALDWRDPVQHVLDNFQVSVTAGGQMFQGFNLVQEPTAGPEGIAWEFTGQMVVTLREVDRLYGESRFAEPAELFLAQIAHAQAEAPFGDGRGLVASTVVNGETLPPIEQALSTPFQDIPERVGLAASNWAIYADQQFNLFSNNPPTDLVLSSTSVPENSATNTTMGTFATTDPDAGDTFTYTLVAGEGDADNSAFRIDGNLLKTAAVFDFESQPSLTIRVRSTDQDGLSLERSFTITITGLRLDIAGRAFGDWWEAASTGSSFTNHLRGHWSTAVEWVDVQVADVNGDGLDDIIGRADGTWWVARATGTRFVNEPWGHWSTAVQWVDVQVADVNGDGLADIVGRTGGDWWVALSTGSRFVNELWGHWSPAVSWVDVQVADVNGDGLDDIVGRADGAWWVARATGTNFVNELWGGWSPAVAWVDVQVADVNGDGLADIVGRTGGDWWVARATGTSFVNELWGHWSNAVTWVDVQVADVNGDGLADIVGRTGGDWWLARATGTSFVNELWGHWSNAVTWVDVVVGNFSNTTPENLQASTNASAATDLPFLGREEVTPLVEEAIAAFARAGADQVQVAELEQVQFSIVDLAGNLLGQAQGHTILIDRDAAGHGYFVDHTPQTDEEFQPAEASASGDSALDALFGSLGGSRLVAVEERGAEGRIDLLTVIMHELGHVLGIEHQPQGLFAESLDTGVRYRLGEATTA